MTTTTKNAKAAEKVAILQNLKTNKGGKIEMLPADVESTIWNVLGYHEKNEVRSQNAGYDIFENEDGDWVSFLGDRVEINLASGETFNLWIVEKTLYYARQHNLVECGFFLDMAAEKGNVKGIRFWLNVIEYKLKNREDAEMWREILKTEHYQAMLANLEIIACIDDYSVDAYAAAEVEEVNEKPSEKEILQEKIAEIKNRKHKSCIDWDAVYNDFRIEEIFNLQRDFKKFLKLGEIKRAENVFENIKLCFKAA